MSTQPDLDLDLDLRPCVSLECLLCVSCVSLDCRQTVLLCLSFDVSMLISTPMAGVDYLPPRAPGTPARHLRGPHAYAGLPVRRSKLGVAPQGAAKAGCHRMGHPSRGGALSQQGAAGGYCTVRRVLYLGTIRSERKRGSSVDFVSNL